MVTRRYDADEHQNSTLTVAFSVDSWHGCATDLQYVAQLAEACKSAPVAMFQAALCRLERLACPQTRVQVRLVRTHRPWGCVHVAEPIYGLPGRPYTSAARQPPAWLTVPSLPQKICLQMRASPSDCRASAPHAPEADAGAVEKRIEQLVGRIERRGTTARSYPWVQPRAFSSNAEIWRVFSIPFGEWAFACCS